MEQLVPQPQPRRYTVAEYFEVDEAYDGKYEFRDGELIDMAGGTESHSLIITNTIGELRNRIKGSGCRVYESNLRVRAKRKVRYVYPDLFVTCGPREVDPADPRRTTVTNPTVVVEVLSPSTQHIDRGEKFDRYLECQSLKEYVLVAQDRPRVWTYFRQPDGTWSFAFYDGLTAVARLRSLNVDLPLAEVYAEVELPPVVEEPDEGE